MPIAAIDVGTNTAQLVVVDANGNRIHRAERFVRLGEGVDASGRIGEAAQERLLEALSAHVQAAQAHGAERIVAAATSAMRDAANRDAVRARIREKTGLTVEILSGEEEARWSFAAACAPFNDLTGDCLVVDVGGGSTELITGTDPSGHAPHLHRAVTGAVSLNVGCIRLTERCIPHLPPPDDALAHAERWIDDALASCDLSAAPGTELVGTAGTATALALVHAGPQSTEAHLQNGGATLSAETVHTWRTRLLQASIDEVHAFHPAAMAGRADVFPVGVLLLDRLMTRFRLPALRVSPYELRYGLALRAMRDE